jgi:phospholipid/cholesterol/gamma-HCH transport system substrate-binding protein
MSPVKGKVEAMMSEIAKTLVVLQEVLNDENKKNLSEGIENLNRTLQNIASLSAGLDTMVNSPKGSIRLSLNNIESISSNIRKNNSDITNTIKNLSSISDSLSKAKLYSTLGKLDSSLNQLQQTMTKVNSGEGTLGKLVNTDSLYRNLESASLQLELLIKDMKTNPQRYVNFSIIDLSRTKYIEEKKNK